ncbi:hypothetical protein AX17_004659 [Amanita inopinata Kibby_2008]|nr:hypothetical protein AX17_004659 [Amanita inopinata Kibby_2008]
MEFTPAPAIHRVLCADCGTAIEPNGANLCVACLRNTIDITEGIPKQASVSFCRNCERFLSPPSAWIPARLESAELLALCLKKLKGLNKVRLTDAHFIWTEPHSKRLRVSLTIQKEVLTSTILEQTFELEYLVQHGQCPDCARLAAKNTWRAMVQVRQKVLHKRTFLFLEQLILKHGVQKDTVSVKEVRDGLDFFYASRSHAIKMVEFLTGVVPVRSKASEQLLSADTHSNTANFKYTYSVEIAPICKDDLICLPLKLSRSLSNISPLVVCTRVGSSVIVLDPATLQHAEISAQVFWRASFESLASVGELVEFMVLDVEVDRKQPHRGGGHQKSKYVMADAQVALAGAFRSSGSAGGGKGGYDDDDGMMDYEALGETNQIYHTRTHLGGILQPGDTVLGYHLTPSNFNSPEFAAVKTERVPDVILVKKTYPNRRKKSRARNWRLKSMAKEASEDESGKGVVGRMGGRDQKKVEEDYELFLRDLEEDEEMRKEVNLYKVKEVTMKVSEKRPGKRAQFAMDVDEAAPVENAVATANGEDAADGEGEGDADFPEVRLEELLDDFDEMTLGDE